MKPLYDLEKSFEYNMCCTPTIDFEIPIRIPTPHKQWKKIFDYEVMSTIGTSACPLGANSKTIELTSQLGFDIITHKTIRSHEQQAYAKPNIGYVAIDDMLQKNDMQKSFIATMHAPENSENICIANSIGNASFDPEWHCYEIIRARQAMQKGQLLIVSIYGTKQNNRTIAQDFVYIADYVRDAGAQVIELNLSCANVQHGILYKDASLVFDICSAVVKETSVPVIAKVGLFDTPEQAQEIMVTIANAGVRGMVGINSVGVNVVNQEGKPFFGESRKISGLSGAPIRMLAQNWTQQVAQINVKEKLNLTIFAAGGVTTAAHFDEFYNVGADVVLSATGAMWNPLLAHAYHTRKEDALAIRSSKQKRHDHQTL